MTDRALQLAEEVKRLIDRLGFYSRQGCLDGDLRDTLTEAADRLAALSQGAPEGRAVAPQAGEVAADKARLDWLDSQWRDGVHLEVCATGGPTVHGLKRTATVWPAGQSRDSAREAIDAAMPARDCDSTAEGPGDEAISDMVAHLATQPAPSRDSQDAFPALQALTEAILTRADNDYMARQIDAAVKVMASRGWVTPVPWPDPEFFATRTAPGRDSTTDSRECAANGTQGCSYGPHGPNGERQCAWCGQQAAPSLTKQLQQKCSDWGTYWRAPDAHGVILSPKQAVELLQDALGVEVEIEQQAAPSEAPAWPTEMKIADVGFLWDDKAQCHIPTLLLKFEPVPANAPCDAKGWADRDAMAKLLASPPSAQPAEKL